MKNRNEVVQDHCKEAKDILDEVIEISIKDAKDKVKVKEDSIIPKISEEEMEIMCIQEYVKKSFKTLDFKCMDLFHNLVSHLSVIECLDFDKYCELVKQYRYIPYIRNSLLSAMAKHIETYAEPK